MLLLAPFFALTPAAFLAPVSDALNFSTDDLVQDTGGGRPGGRPGGFQPGGAPPAAPDDFEKVVKDFDAKKGAVNTYIKGDTLYFEIPKDKMGRDFLLYQEMKGTASGGYSGSGLGQTVIRFEMRDEKVLARGVDYSVLASKGNALQRAVAMSNIAPIVAVFDVKAKSPDGGVLIDVSRIFKSGIPELPLAGAVGGGQVDSSRTFIDRVLTFPQNVNIEVLATGTGGGGGGNPLGGRRGGGSSRPTSTVLVHTSMVLLPEKPMMGRLNDSRVGFFSTGYTDYGLKTTGTEQYSFIDRYRLEKKDPTAAISDPVKPIVYYISSEVPEIWRPYIKKGIEDWQAAFLQAGFSNAIIAKDAPNDPNWSSEDVRYSTIRWAPLPIENALGPHVSDPRSGEILSGHVIIWHDVIKLGMQWYFSQASASDKRAQMLPFPNELIGEIMRFIVSHEVGHTLGLPHNGKSSAMVPTEWLRSSKWTNENGTAGSLMDYARFNYVAQPGDNARLIPIVGAYDKFSIAWGYKPIPAAKNPWDEEKTLDQWASVQVNNPLMRFYDNFNSTDPTAMAEALGDDAVTASTYGVANLKRIMGFLPKATIKQGEDYSQLSDYYSAVVSELGLFVGHVGQMVGGVVETDYHGGRGGAVYTPVPRARQRAAVTWLLDNIIQTPTFLVPSNVVDKLGPTSGLNTVGNLQRRVFTSLLNDARVNRMLDNEAMYSKTAFPASEMMQMLRAAVWKGVSSGSRADAYTRNMQRNFVSALAGKLTGSPSELRGLAFEELTYAQRTLQRGAALAGDSATRAHYSNLAQLIDQTLKFPPTPPAAPAAPTGFPFGNVAGGEEIEEYGCGIMAPHAYEGR